MKIVILGTGSFGTALSNLLCINGHNSILWGINQQEIDDINNNKLNSKYFDNIKLHNKVIASNDLNILKDTDIILFAIPSIVIEDICQKIIPYINKEYIAINVAKGFHPISHKRLSEVIYDNLKDHKLKDVVSLIGPSHAEELINNKLTCVNAVCYNKDSAKLVQQVFSNDFFRVYYNTDVIGCEIGVALKNIMAISSGIIDGLKQGENARAALISRGLKEIVNYGLYFGAKKETYLGLCGLGDLIVTCTSSLSRNYNAGYQIGLANCASEYLKNNTKTVEGVICTKIVHEVSKEYNINMPICNQVYEVLYNNKKPSESIKELMSRTLKKESF